MNDNNKLEQTKSTSLNINKEVFEEYHAKDQLRSIYILTSFTIALAITNIMIIVFIILLNHQASVIKLKNAMISTEMESKEISNKNQQTVINHKLIALYNSIKIFRKEFTNIIKTETEINTLLNWIDADEFRLYPCYMYHYNSYDPFDVCSSDSTLIFLIQTESNHRFGAILRNYTRANRHRGNTGYDSQAFLFNFDTKRVFPIKDANNAYDFLESENLISFGKDLVIDLNYLNKVSHSKFPSSYGNYLQDKLDDFNGGEGSFLIEYLEIFNLH